MPPQREPLITYETSLSAGISDKYLLDDLATHGLRTYGEVIRSTSFQSLRMLSGIREKGAAQVLLMLARQGWGFESSPTAQVKVEDDYGKETLVDLVLAVELSIRRAEHRRVITTINRLFENKLLFTLPGNQHGLNLAKIQPHMPFRTDKRYRHQIHIGAERATRPDYADFQLIPVNGLVATDDKQRQHELTAHSEVFTLRREEMRPVAEQIGRLLDTDIDKISRNRMQAFYVTSALIRKSFGSYTKYLNFTLEDLVIYVDSNRRPSLSREDDRKFESLVAAVEVGRRLIADNKPYEPTSVVTALLDAANAAPDALRAGLLL